MLAVNTSSTSNQQCPMYPVLLQQNLHCPADCLQSATPIYLSTSSKPTRAMALEFTALFDRHPWCFWHDLFIIISYKGSTQSSSHQFFLNFVRIKSSCPGAKWSSLQSHIQKFLKLRRKFCILLNTAYPPEAGYTFQWWNIVNLLAWVNRSCQKHQSNLSQHASTKSFKDESSDILISHKHKHKTSTG